MSSPEQLRPLNGMRDHGFGPIGQLAHGVLADYLGAPPPAPRLHLGQNTLPDPPFPLASHIAFPAVDGGWEKCGEDLPTFLAASARSLRAQPVPASSVFSEQQRMMQRMLRMDSIALAWQARMILPVESVPSWTLTADILAGRADPTDLDPDDSNPALLTWVVDRSGTALLAWTPADGAADQIAVSDALDHDDPIIALLADLLDAQYTWTVAAFGAVP
jgi:hypothetical protein